MRAFSLLCLPFWNCEGGNWVCLEFSLLCFMHRLHEGDWAYNPHIAKKSSHCAWVSDEVATLKTFPSAHMTDGLVELSVACPFSFPHCPEPRVDRAEGACSRRVL